MTPRLVRVYDRTTGRKNPRPVPAVYLQIFPNLAVVPSRRRAPVPTVTPNATRPRAPKAGTAATKEK